ncbi:MAG: hypothetical protein ABIS50_04610 [Luteolibacter sp.]|uniref:hypothetical protein n=1 Tax=Luteolibacter sp. TaxID=1962973 RepID=UPI00326341AB
MTKLLASFRLMAIPLAALVLSSQLQAIPIRVLAWDSEVAAMHLAIRDSKGVTVIESMHPSKRTAAYKIATGKTPLVVEALDLKGPDGKPITTEIKIPEGMKQPLLVIQPAEKPGDGIRIIVLEDDAKTFDWGSTRFINTTDKKLVFSYEKETVELPPSLEPVKVKPGGDARNMEVKFFSSDQLDRPFYSGIWEHDPELRTLIFLASVEDTGTGPVAMKMISEDRRNTKAADGKR